MAPARGRVSASIARQSRVPTELPDYQPPAHPLNLAAQQAIRDLPRSHKLDTLKARLQAANKHLTESAAEINDHFQERNAQNEKRKARRAGAMSSQESNGDAERELHVLRVATDDMTGQLDAGVRKIIDAGEEVKAVEGALRELNTNVAAGRGVLASTQSTLGASQFRQNQRRGSDDEGGQDEIVSPGSVEVLKQKLGQHRTAYEMSTMADRYASHNDYVGFKKIVHDAHYPGDEAPPMPHASTWFGEGDAHESSRSGPGPSQSAEDDDLVMAAERISVKCPITLTEMKDPVSSNKCPHNFEREAFLEMVNNSELRIDGDGRRNNGKKAMRCPVAGCDVVLSAEDVHTDDVMVRRIKRGQAALRARNEPDYEDDEGSSSIRHRRGETGYHDERITSSPAQPRASGMSLAHAKSERMSQAPHPRQPSMVPNSQIVDVEDDETDETDEEGE